VKDCAATFAQRSNRGDWTRSQRCELHMTDILAIVRNLLSDYDTQAVH
jgi:hypothetical protein